MGFLDVLKNIGSAIESGVRGAVGAALAPLDLIRDIKKVFQGENVLNLIKNSAFKKLKNNLATLATPIKVVHSVSDELGITEEVDLLLMVIPGPTGAILEASQLAETAEELIKLKEQMDAMERQFAEMERLLEEELDRLLNAPDDPTELVDPEDIAEEAKSYMEEIYPNPTKVIPESIKFRVEKHLKKMFQNSLNQVDIIFAVRGIDLALKFLDRSADAFKLHLRKTMGSMSKSQKFNNFTKWQKMLFAKRDFHLSYINKTLGKAKSSPEYQNMIKKYIKEIAKKNKEAQVFLKMN